MTAAGVLDILEEDSRWFSWSADRLAECAGHSALIINPVSYAEVSAGFARIEELEEALPLDVDFFPPRRI